MRRIAIITGASSGLGSEFVRQLAEKNDYDELWAVARRGDRLERLAQEANAQSGKELVRAVTLDVSGKDGALRFKKLLEAEQDFCIGLLVNNAGFGTYGPFEETDPEREMELIDLNCTALTGICGFALPYLARGSVIINTASLAAFLPLGNFAVYAASKAYVLSFSVALAAELRHRGIFVCALCPGSVSTEFADVASNGVRKEVKGGIGTQKVVRHCLSRAFRGKKTALYRLKWRVNAFLSRFVGRYAGAWLTYHFHKRPH